MQDKFRIRLCSDLDYEEMVVDISYENCTIAMITQENGIDNMEIKILPPENEINAWTFPLNDFIQIILFAKKSLLEMQKLPEE